MLSRPDIPDHPYDWRATRRPERPWRHAYHQTLVDAVWVAHKADPKTGTPPRVDNSLDRVLTRIRHIDAVTRGIPKITHLIGWHHDGHDSKYPDWAEVNPRLRLDGHRSAADSIIWLMEQARHHNTTVTLHVNMLDAYENSPLWQEYLDRDIFVRKDGLLYRCPWAVWDGEQAFWIDYAREWDCGLAQRRIDGLLDMLPIREQGTIHIDAFYVPDHTDPERSKAAMRRIFRYFGSRNIDVTSETMRYCRHGEDFLGLQPMAWHINHWGATWENPEVSETEWFDIPPSLFCGGLDHLALEHGQLFGTSMQGSEFTNIDDFRTPFCLQTLPWFFLNRFDRVRLSRDGDNRTLHLSDGVVSDIRDGRRTIRQHGRLLLDDTDLCLPAPWRPGRELIAFSLAGCRDRQWVLPPDWHDVAAVNVHDIRCTGTRLVARLPVIDNTIALTLEPGQEAAITPAPAHPDA